MGLTASLQAMRRDRRLMRLVGVALLIRVLILVLSVGSNDVGIWAWVANHIQQLGLLGAYEAIFEANHPPAAALYMSWAFGVDSGLLFPWLVKLPALVGDMATAALIWHVVARHRGPETARGVTVAYLFNPLTILLSAFHGNTDVLYVALLFAATVALAEDRPGWAGLLYGATLNVKLLPVAFGAAFLVLLVRRGGLGRFVAAAAIALTPVWTVMAMRPSTVPGRLIGYLHPVAEPWGLTGLELLARDTEQVWYHANGRVILAVALVLAAGWTYDRHLGPYRTVGLSVATFLLLTPAFGLQYLAPLVPFLFVVAPRLGAVYGLAGGAFLAVAYASTMDGWLPATAHFTEPLGPVPVALAAVAWLVVAASVVRLAGRSGDREPVHRSEVALDGVPVG